MQLLSTKKNKLLLLLPTCLVYVVYIILPILVSLYYSFTKYSGISKPRLYGLKNYIRLLDDPYFWIALKNTAIILGISILLLGIGAFFVAMPRATCFFVCAMVRSSCCRLRSVCASEYCMDASEM